MFNFPSLSQSLITISDLDLDLYFFFEFNVKTQETLDTGEIMLQVILKAKIFR